MLGWTSAGELKAEQDTARAAQAQWREQIATKSVAEIEQSEELRTFAITGGRALFNQNCAACHGLGAGGQQGQFPSLIDDDWLWGGKIEDVYQ
ncbi:c-type cytochrome, partial [Microbacteriaceae bacterium K1510]|nr:c-type cytochrome [Microbacteriaceae bacterium K1510]